MSQTTLQDCIKILQDKPTWFFQKEEIAAKLQSLETIQQLGTPGTIYVLYPFIKHNNKLIQSKTAETMLQLFSSIRSLNGYKDTLRYLPVELNDMDMFLREFEEETAVQLLAMASLNYNGYVREKAVTTLSQLKNKTGLKFILLRLGDWVPAVRKAAMTAVDAFLEPACLDALLQELPTIDWLLKVQRVDLSDMHHRIHSFILEQTETPGFFQQINTLSDRIRYRFYKLYVAGKPLTPELMEQIRRDRNFLVRHILFQQLPVFDNATQERLVGFFLRDRSVRLRLEALYASKPFAPAFHETILTFLSDENASVRELCRRLLKLGGAEAAALYRKRIAEKEMLAGSLAGLAETGTAQDMNLFEVYLLRGNRLVVLACLAAIYRFDEARGREQALELLTHPSRRVREQAKDILARRCDSGTLQRIRQLYATADQALKKTLLPLYQQIGGWPIAGDLLLALKEVDPDIQEIAWRELETWRQKATRLFTTFPEAEQERAALIFRSIDRTRLQMNIWREKLLGEMAFILGLRD